jgi:NitT/TauT family transport system permease protein
MSTAEAYPTTATGVLEEGTVNRKKLRRVIQPMLIRCASLITCLVLWQLASANKWNFIVNFENIPAPTVVCAAAVNLVQSPKFQSHLVSSIGRVFAGFGSATMFSYCYRLGGRPFPAR